MPGLALDASERQELQRRRRATTVTVRERQRAEIVLLRAEGLTQSEIAEQLGVSRVTVNQWCHLYTTQHLADLDDAPGRGRKPWLPPETVRSVLEKAVKPPATLGRWSCRTMAREAGISQASVQRISAANDIKPHLSPAATATATRNGWPSSSRSTRQCGSHLDIHLIADNYATHKHAKVKA